MPTITISTSDLPAPRRRAIALRVTRWLAGHGVRPGHVVVRFEIADESRVLVGGWPVDALPRPPEGLHHASVTCCVSPDRDDDFRAGLAEQIAESLGLTTATPFFYLEFRPTSPAYVHIAASGPLGRTDQPVESAATEGRSR